MMFSILRRSVVRHGPGHLATVLTLAAAVASLLAVIAVSHNFFVAPWPYDSSRLGVVTHATPESVRPSFGLSAAEYRALRDSGLFETVIASRASTQALAGREGFPRRVRVVRSIPEARQVGGVAPLLGRFIEADDRASETGADAAVISHELWQSEFGGRADVVGQALRVDGAVYPVVGVMPARFHLMGGDIWVPYAVPPGLDTDTQRVYVVNVLARRGQSMEDMATALAQLGAQLAAEGPASAYPGGWALRAGRVIDEVMGPMRPAVVLLLVAAASMLLIALINVATLIDVRQIAERSQQAMRLVLGAGLRRLVFEAFVLNTALALLGVGLGWLLGWVVFDQVVGMISDDWVPRELEGQFVYGGVSAMWIVPVALACAALMTFAQWLRLRGIVPQQAIGEGTRAGVGASVLKACRGLAIGQVAAAALVGVLSGCVWLGVQTASRHDLGMRTEGVLGARLTLPQETYPDAAARARFVQALRHELAASLDVAFVDTAPFQRYQRAASVSAQGGQESVPVGLRSSIGPLHEVLGLALRAGRFIDDERDLATSDPVVVVSQALAQRLWGDGDALGRTLTLGADATPRRVVGIVSDLRYAGALASVEPMLFIPYAQDPAAPSTLALLARGRDARLPALAPILAAVAAQDPWIPVYEADAVAGRARESMAGLALAETVFKAFALLAAALALMGTAVVARFLIAVRRHEYAVRSALGATPRLLFGSVMGEGLRIGVIGTLAGAALAWSGAHALNASLHDAAPWHWMPVAVVIATLMAAVMVTCAGAARNAARTNPVRALRQ